MKDSEIDKMKQHQILHEQDLEMKWTLKECALNRIKDSDIDKMKRHQILHEQELAMKWTLKEYALNMKWEIKLISEKLLVLCAPLTRFQKEIRQYILGGAMGVRGDGSIIKA